MKRGTRKDYLPTKPFPARFCGWRPLRFFLLARHLGVVACLCPLAYGTLQAGRKRFGCIDFANVRVVIVFFFLVPALAFHWSAKKA